MFDYHTHTKFSFDSSAEPEIMVEVAAAAGLLEICITDDVDIFPGEQKAEIDLQAYHRTIDSLKKSAKGIAVKKGIELGVDQSTAELYQQICRENQFDFIICSQHFVKDIDPYEPVFFEGRMVREAYEEYLEENFKTLQVFDAYSVVGHIGYPAKYCKAADPRMTFAQYGDWIEAILRHVIARGKGIELNTSGYLMTGPPIHACDVLRRYREMGGEILTIGSDAHSPERVGDGIEKGVAAARAAGFRYLCTFEEMEPVFHQI
mgnify:CR=1 FL=1